MKKLSYLFVFLAIVSFVACGGGEEKPNETENPEMAEDHPDHEGHDGHDHMPPEESADIEFEPAVEGAKVFFANLKDGDVVSSPVSVEMGVEGMTVHPAGEVISGTGHHHIVIDNPAVPMIEMVPADEFHIHFGGGQTETQVELTPGPHTLTLQFADGLHRSYGEEMSATVQIEVQAAE